MNFVGEINLISPTKLLRFADMTIKPRSSQTRSCYDYLRRQLLHGQLAPGSRLVEEKWATQLGVHRSALRESLMILAHEGLLDTGRAGGFFVPAFDRAALDEVLEVRIALETGALRALALRGDSPRDLRRLRHACDLMEQTMEAGFEFGFVEADRRFHEILVEMAGNKRLVRVYRQAPLPLAPIPEPEEGARRENMRETLADHRRLCDLLDERRLDDAVRLLRHHLLRDHSRYAGRAPAPPDE